VTNDDIDQADAYRTRGRKNVEQWWEHFSDSGTRTVLAVNSTPWVAHVELDSRNPSGLHVHQIMPLTPSDLDRLIARLTAVRSAMKTDKET